MEDRKQKETAMELGLEFAPEEQAGRKTAQECWQQFLHTGSVVDYLNYATISREENTPMRIR